METMLYNQKNLNILQEYEKFCLIKKICGLKTEDNITIFELQKRIDEILLKNYFRLTTINHAILQLPKPINNLISKILILKDCPDQYEKVVKQYQENFVIDSEFKDFSQYIFMQIAGNIIEEHEVKNLITDSEIYEIKKEYYSIFFLLLYHIVKDECRSFLKFNTENFIYNLPLLMLWIRKNKFLPIEELSHDDCEILSGLFYGLDYENLLLLNLSSSAQNYYSICNIIENLPKKFHVNNITQTLFRILLFKPFVLNNSNHEDIVQSIKEIKCVRE